MKDLSKRKSKFISEFSHHLMIENKWDVKIPTNGFGNFIIQSDSSDEESDKRIFIKVEDAKEYGELPISTIIPISNQTIRSRDNDYIILISLSDVCKLLSKKLKEINVILLIKPTIYQIMNEINFIFKS